MDWFLLSILIGYSLIVVLSVFSLVVQYNLFFAESTSVHFATSFTLSNNTNVKYKYFNSIANVNSAWFVYSVFISFFLFVSSTVYYTIIYGKVIIKQLWSQSTQSSFDFFNEYAIIDFVFLSLNLSWSVLWILHLGIETVVFYVSRRSQEELSLLYLLLSLQIGLVALRYPQLFHTHVLVAAENTTNSSSNVVDDDMNDIDEISQKIELVNTRKPRVESLNLKFKI